MMQEVLDELPKDIRVQEIGTLGVYLGASQTNTATIISLLFLAFILPGCTAIEEKRAWEAARRANVIENYEAFLKQYPQSEFAEEAQARIEGLRWEQAQREDTIEGYEAFLERHPQSEFAGEAQARIDYLRKERHPAFSEARRARITISEYYEQAPNASAGCIWEATENIMQGIAVEVVESGEYDFTIEVEIRGRPLSAYYYGAGQLYTGASVTGKVAFRTTDSQEVIGWFQDQRDPPWTFSHSGDLPETPDEAPFDNNM